MRPRSRSPAPRLQWRGVPPPPSLPQPPPPKKAGARPRADEPKAKANKKAKQQALATYSTSRHQVFLSEYGLSKREIADDDDLGIPEEVKALMQRGEVHINSVVKVKRRDGVTEVVMNITCEERVNLTQKEAKKRKEVPAKDQNTPEFIAAKKTEIDGLAESTSVKLVPVEEAEGKNIVSMRWVCTWKVDENGVPYAAKARWLADSRTRTVAGSLLRCQLLTRNPRVLFSGSAWSSSGVR